MRRAAKTDTNHAEIRDGLRQRQHGRDSHRIRTTIRYSV